jgi:hypothetical protein
MEFPYVKVPSMRALFLRQQEKYKSEWYRVHNQKPPSVEFEDPPPPKKEPYVQTITDTYIVDGFRPEPTAETHLDMSYWETDDAGPEPIEFRSSLNTARSDSVVSWTELPLPDSGEINRCFTPYENDIMSYGVLETVRLELRRRGDHLANEMDRVDSEFRRPPKKNWFCLKNSRFSIEHIRFNELRRRRAARFAHTSDAEQ